MQRATLLLLPLLAAMVLMLAVQGTQPATLLLPLVPALLLSLSLLMRR